MESCLCVAMPPLFVLFLRRRILYRFVILGPLVTCIFIYIYIYWVRHSIGKGIPKRLGAVLGNPVLLAQWTFVEPRTSGQVGHLMAVSTSLTPLKHQNRPNISLITYK